MTVSASLPISAKSVGANTGVSGSAKTMPITTSTPVTASRPFTTCDPSRHAASLPAVVRWRVNVGTNAALIAPSANRSRSSVGMRVASDERVHDAAGAEEPRLDVVADEAEDPARRVASPMSPGGFARWSSKK